MNKIIYSGATVYSLEPAGATIADTPQGAAVSSGGTVQYVVAHVTAADMRTLDTELAALDLTQFTYTVIDGVLVATPIAVPAAALPRITKLAFRNRFTTAEKVMIDLASIDNPSAPMPARQQAAAVRVSLADAAAATYIDLSREDTRAGVQMLEAAGILGAGRALEILDAEILDSERVQ